MLVIDAANVLHAASAQPWPISELESAGLIRLVASLQLGRRGAVLAFDGAIPVPTPRDPPGVRVLWSGTDREADDVIEELLVIDSAASRIRVVSSDRRLRLAARRAGAVSETSADFLHRVYDEMIARGKRLPPPPIRQEVPLDRAMLAMWLEEFGFNPALASVTTVPEPARKAAPSLRGQDERGASQGEPRTDPAREVVPTPAIDDRVGFDASGSAHPARIDDELVALLKLWGGSLSEADLNMQLWLETHPPPDASSEHA